MAVAVAVGIGGRPATVCLPGLGNNLYGQLPIRYSKGKKFAMQDIDVHSLSGSGLLDDGCDIGPDTVEDFVGLLFDLLVRNLALQCLGLLQKCLQS
ncbi:hypothetical protein ES703_30242 [subsurface metagenome]